MEKDISNQIIAYINKQPGCLAYKRLSNGSSSTNGYPDITGVVKLNFGGLKLAVHLEIETKQPGCKPESIQYKRLRDFRQLGCVAFWTDSKKDCVEKLDLWQKVLLKKAKHPGYGDLSGRAAVMLQDLKPAA